MKVCVECGESFKPIGRQKVCKVCKDEEKAIQKAEETREETKVVRPLDRFGNGRFVFGSGAGVILRR